MIDQPSSVSVTDCHLTSFKQMRGVLSGDVGVAKETLTCLNHTNMSHDHPGVNRKQIVDYSRNLATVMYPPTVRGAGALWVKWNFNKISFLKTIQSHQNLSDL